jgi:hypothetical protein
MNKLNISVLLTTICFLVGCPRPPQPVALHPVGAADCHPTEVAATIVDDSKPVQPEEPKPWWTTHSAHCADNMRRVEPSMKESEAKSGVNAAHDEYWNWRTQHTYCIPDGM